MNYHKKIERENIKQRLNNLLPGESPIIENITSEKVIFYTSHGREAADLKMLKRACNNYSKNEMALHAARYIK